MWTDYYAVEDGRLYELQETVTSWGDRRVECIGRKHCYDFGVKRNAYPTREAAKTAAELKIYKRLTSLRRQIARLEALRFDETAIA